MAFVLAASRGEIPAGTIREVHLGDTTIAVANVEGSYYAIDNTCLHRGGPLGQGELDGKVVTCPVHGWQYDVTTGQVTFSPEMAVRTYRVELRGDEIYIDVG